MIFNCVAAVTICSDLVPIKKYPYFLRENILSPYFVQVPMLTRWVERRGGDLNTGPCDSCSSVHFIKGW